MARTLNKSRSADDLFCKLNIFFFVFLLILTVFVFNQKVLRVFFILIFVCFLCLSNLGFLVPHRYLLYSFTFHTFSVCVLLPLLLFAFLTVEMVKIDRLHPYFFFLHINFSGSNTLCSKITLTAKQNPLITQLLSERETWWGV